jgi:predicted kinase
VYTDERNTAAWEHLYSELELLLRNATSETRLFIVMGVQGGGKTTWIRENQAVLGPAAVCLDAAVPARRHRARALNLARRFGIPAVGVWVNTPLERALAQNAGRPPDEVVPVVAIRSVFELLEAPSIDEGFDQIAWR